MGVQFLAPMIKEGRHREAEEEEGVDYLRAGFDYY